MDKEWLTTRDVADRLGYSTRWVERQIELGRLRATAYVAGEKRTFRVRATDADRFWRAYFHDALTDEPTGGSRE